MPPGTFSRSGMSVSLEESPPLPRKRQRLAEGGEDVNVCDFALQAAWRLDIEECWIPPDHEKSPQSVRTEGS